MAYKNQKKNKKHVQHLKQDPYGWRKRNKRKLKQARHHRKVRELIAKGYSRDVAERAAPFML